MSAAETSRLKNLIWWAIHGRKSKASDSMAGIAGAGRGDMVDRLRSLGGATASVQDAPESQDRIVVE